MGRRKPNLKLNTGASLKVNIQQLPSPSTDSSTPSPVTALQTAPFYTAVAYTPAPQTNANSGLISILPNLYLGSEYAASNPALLKQHGVRYVLNVAKEVENPYRHSMRPISTVGTGMEGLGVQMWEATNPSDGDVLEYIKFPWGHNQQDLLTYFPHAFKYITSIIPHTPILIHCQAGLSRSAALVMAFVMYRMSIPFTTAYEWVKTKNGAVSPNMVLVMQLMELQTKLASDLNNMTNTHLNVNPVNHVNPANSNPNGSNLPNMPNGGNNGRLTPPMEKVERFCGVVA